MQMIVPAAAVLHPYLKPGCSGRFVDMDTHKQIRTSFNRPIYALRKANVLIAIAHHVYGYAIILLKLIAAIPSNGKVEVFLNQATIGRATVGATMPSVQGNHHLIGGTTIRGKRHAIIRRNCNRALVVGQSDRLVVFGHFRNSVGKIAFFGKVTRIIQRISRYAAFAFGGQLLFYAEGIPSIGIV